VRTSNRYAAWLPLPGIVVIGIGFASASGAIQHSSQVTVTVQ
jgi:hypothetical protein